MKTSATTPSLSKLYAEGDKLFGWAIYGDVTGSLTLGMPLYVDIRDAAEFNIQLTSTAVSSASANYQTATAGKVVLGTTSAGTGSNLTCIGIYAPVQGYGYKPANGEVVRVLIQGRGVVAVCAKSGGTAVTVGAKILVSSSTLQAICGSAAASQVIGTILATTSFVASTNQIAAVPGSGQTNVLANAYVCLC
jgi:hypothetical protein